MKSDALKTLFLKGVRFLIAGGINFGITLILYQLLLFIVNPQIAYALTWIAGLFIVIVFYPSKVFGSDDVSHRQKLEISGLYGASFLLGLACIWALSSTVVGPRLAIFAALVVTTIVNFVGMSLILAKQKPNKL